MFKKEKKWCRKKREKNMRESKTETHTHVYVSWSSVRKLCLQIDFHLLFPMIDNLFLRYAKKASK